MRLQHVPVLQRQRPCQLAPVLIKRYARSRLYDKTNRRYVSLDQLRDWAAKGIAFVVQDSETGADVMSVLLA
jgi:polyhydroxyalkanoate synthesis regulator protein